MTDCLVDRGLVGCVFEGQEVVDLVDDFAVGVVHEYGDLLAVGLKNQDVFL